MYGGSIDDAEKDTSYGHIVADEPDGADDDEEASCAAAIEEPTDDEVPHAVVEVHHSAETRAQ